MTIDFIKKSLLFFLFFLFFSLGLHRVASTIPSVVFILLSFTMFFFDKKSRVNIVKTTSNKTLFSFLTILSFYVSITLFSYFQTDSNSDFIKVEKLKIFFLLIPLSFYFSKEYIVKHLKTLFTISIYGSIFSIFMFLIIALFRYKTIGTNAFFYSDLFSVSFINPIIYSLYINVNFALLSHLNIVKNKYLKQIILLLFSVIIIMSISKIGIIILFFNYLYNIKLLYNKNKKKGVLMILFFITLILISIKIGSNSQVIHKRIKHVKSNYIQFKNNNLTKSFPRLSVYKSASEIIKENFWFGVGLSNVKKELLEKFKKMDFAKGIAYNLDAHNEFLQSFIGSGILGFLSMLSIFLYLFLVAFKQKDKLLLNFILIVFVYALIESIFESQMSVFVFLLYSCSLLIRDQSKILFSS